MTAEESKDALLRRLRGSESRLGSVLPSEGIDAMLDFYLAERAEGRLLEEDGDMLLFQWGAYDRGEGEFFEIDITRQFISGGLEDENFLQLSLTFRYAATAELRGLGRGDRWLERPEDLEGFRQFILESAAYKLLRQKGADQVEARLDGV
jgi:hypothetical protein